MCCRGQAVSREVHITLCRTQLQISGIPSDPTPHYRTLHSISLFLIHTFFKVLTRIIYVSRAPSAGPFEIKNILLASRKNNPVLGITGALCFLDGIYLQYLEGEASAVNALYQKIEKDPRHSHTKPLVHEQISQRAHPKWSMALLTWNEETKAILRLFNPDSALDAYAIDPASVSSLLQAWADTPNWMTL